MVDADRVEDVYIERAYFHVFDPAAPERRRRPLTGKSDPLWANRAVILVFDLQLIDAELTVFAILLDTNLLVSWLRRRHGIDQIGNVIIKIVQRYIESRLSVIAISQIAHAQRSAIGFKHRFAVEALHVGICNLTKRFADRR